MEISKNKIFMSLASMILVIMASMLMMFGMLAPISGNKATQDSMTEEITSSEHPLSGEYNISDVLESYNYTTGLSLQEPITIFDVLNQAQAIKQTLSIEDTLHSGSPEFWAASTYWQSYLSSAQTAVAGFSFFMIAIVSIGWTWFLFAKKES